MLGRLTPLSLLDHQLSALRMQLGGVFDGCVDAIHDGRIATRRIRELLALAGGAGEPGNEILSRFRQLGRALGRVRDIDVRAGLLRNLETHAPHIAPTIVVLRLEQDRDRVERMRDLIKALERLNIDVLLRRARVGGIGANGVRRLAGGTWREPLRDLIAARAGAAAERIQHATGVYFPNRSHNARIALKKLRYAAEIADLTGMYDLRIPLKSLKKSQETLGRLHDRQDLMDLLTDPREDTSVVPDHLKLSLHVLEAELRDHHARYLARRPLLVEAVTEIHAATVRRVATPARTALLGGALALSGFIYARNRRTG